jgi:RNA 2',3'-cyclic 3'-phosphodiesterase
LRTFIALNLDRDTRAELHRSLEPMREKGWPMRWTAAPTLHLTLRFLGDIEGSEVPRLEESLRAVAAKHGPQRLEIGGFGAFPSLRRANVLWVGLAPTQPLMALQRDVELATSKLGYGRDAKPFRPHITVARLTSGARAPDVERSTGDYDYSHAVDVLTMELMRSHLDPDGAKHEALARFTLGERVDS